MSPGERWEPATPVERIAAGFVRMLRSAGLQVPPDRLVAFVEALDRLGLGERNGVYWAGRSTLLAGPDEREVFDRVFAVFWDGARAADAVLEEEPVSLQLHGPEAEKVHDSGEPDEDRVDTERRAARSSRTELLSHKDFAECDEDELAELSRLFADLRVATSRRRSRRLTASRRERGRPDLARTVRRALRTGGQPFRRYFREPDTRPRRLVLLIDVSGSMEPYARALLRFAHAAVAGRARVEAFTFGTRLTRVTRELSTKDPDRALAKASRSVEDWSGGTRIGESLRRFCDEWGVRGMARGAQIVILSDGWERDEPEGLAEQMARLKRVAYRIVWVNPLKHTAGYAPLARGMAAALPYVDAFMDGHSLASLRDLAQAVAT